MPEFAGGGSRRSRPHLRGLDRELANREFASGPFSIADIALIPHLASAKAMEVAFSSQVHPTLARWLKQARTLPICAADLKCARDDLGAMQQRDLERKSIFGVGSHGVDLARGFHPAVP
jgi:glutathione S-transferase